VIGNYFLGFNYNKNKVIWNIQEMKMSRILKFLLCYLRVKAIFDQNELMSTLDPIFDIELIYIN